MELYTIILHFPDTYGALKNKELNLENTEYYNTLQEAIERTLTIANAFVTPKPDYYYLEDSAGRTIWTDFPEPVKKAIHYERVTTKPTIYRLSNTDEK